MKTTEQPPPDVPTTVSLESHPPPHASELLCPDDEIHEHHGVDLGSEGLTISDFNSSGQRQADLCVRLDLYDVD